LLLILDQLVRVQIHPISTDSPAPWLQGSPPQAGRPVPQIGTTRS
jgi:hypothetical protein